MTTTRRHLAALLRGRRVRLFRPPDPRVAARLLEGDRDLQRQLVDLRAAQDYRYDLRPPLTNP
jgi:hypothetical protein